MSVQLYMDVHVRRAITEGLRLRGVGVLTAQEDGAGDFEDPDLLDRATALGRVLFTQDDDLLREANQCLADLELIAQASEPAEWVNRTEYLPLTCTY